jgi:protein-tyrosine-phosphatase
MVEEADEILVMENAHREAVLSQWPEGGSKVRLLADAAHMKLPWGNQVEIPDPIRMSDHFYENVSKVIRDCVRRIAERFAEESGEGPNKKG